MYVSGENEPLKKSKGIIFSNYIQRNWVTSYKST